MYLAQIILQLLALPVTLAGADGEVLIEGDSSLVDVVLAAQKTNAVTGKQGFLEADVELLTDGTTQTSGTVSVLWNERGTAWDYAVKTKRTSGSSTSEGKIIRDGKSHLFFNSAASGAPNSHFAAITQSEVFTIPEYLKIMPADLWFQIDTRVSAVDMLDPHYKSEFLEKYIIRKDGDHIVIQRHHIDGGYFEFRVSLNHNGNLVAYERNLEGGEGIWTRGRFDWTQNTAGDWYVQSLRLEQSFAGSAAKIDHIIAVDVTAYDAHLEIAEKQFSIDAFEFPPGTNVEEYGPDGKLRRKRRIAKSNGNEISDEEFSNLAETLRQGRFIRGKK